MMNLESLETILPSELPASVSAHPGAVIYRGAELGRGVIIGPHAVVGPRVVIGDGVEIGPGVVIFGRTKIGKGTKVFSYATVGSMPQDLKYAGEDTELIVGENNLIREYVNISIGTKGGGGITKIGNHNLFMAYVHIAHDCLIKDHCIFANSSQIGGHVEIGNHAVFGGLAGVHQFCKVGDVAMVAAGSAVVQDVPPYCIVHGDRAVINGINLIGLKRAGFGHSDVNSIKAMYKAVFQESLTVEAATTKIAQTVTPSAVSENFVRFVRGSVRGLCR